ncbi:thiolase family protein [Simkania negevensis]|uniref:Thiolase family protein n=1 Tax=Simkania negevensis TaxID=83561 RepID=A0ABS3ARC1_9BACT|nr:thiolase family protein [Simkania negevensis]
MEKRVAIVSGVRTPFCKAGKVFASLEADDLGALVVKELVARTAVALEEIDEIIVGNVIPPLHALNIARVVGQKAYLPDRVVASTVNKNCASGMEAISSAVDRIRLGEASVVIAGGTESMTNIPFGFNKRMVALFKQLSKAKTFAARLKAVSRFKLSFLSPVVPGLIDPVCGLSMGETAEFLAREFSITRKEQDAYAFISHQRAAAAVKEGKFVEEIFPVVLPPRYEEVQHVDDGIRMEQTIEELEALRPVFDRQAGTVTAGSSSQISDGAACLLLMPEEKAKALSLEPLGYLRSYAYAGLDGRRMGLGPAYATAKLLKKTGMTMEDFDLIELNEAFAAQVIANERAFSCQKFAQRFLNRSEALGEIGRDRLNVNGGAIAFGHPVGASGARLVLTLLKELRRRNNNLGLATLCVGGGQGAAFALEVS